jgi:hypothetical protein
VICGLGAKPCHVTLRLGVIHAMEGRSDDGAWRMPGGHRERGIAIRRGRGRHEAEQFHVRFCFPDTATADVFRERFGGTRLTYSPSKRGRPSGPRVERFKLLALVAEASCRQL